MSTLHAPSPAALVIEGASPHLLIVRAPYYRDIVDGLGGGATRILEESGASFDVVDVAGALELAGAIRLAVQGARRFDGYVALGCVVKGETDHYEFVCREAMSGLTQVALQHGLCLGNGLLTVNSADQAMQRSGREGHNKGAEAAIAALRQIAAARWLGSL